LCVTVFENKNSATLQCAVVLGVILGIIAAVALPPDNISYIERVRNIEEQKGLQDIKGHESGITQSN